MDSSDILKLIDISLEYFNAQVSELIDKIVSILEEDASYSQSINREHLTQHFFKELFRFNFRGSPYNQQLIIDSPETFFNQELFELLLDTPDSTIAHHTFLLYDHPLRIISEFIFNNKIKLFSLTKGIREYPEFKRIQEDIADNYHAFLSKSFQNSKPLREQAENLLGLLIHYNIISYIRGRFTEDLKRRYAEVFINLIQDKPPRVFYLGALSGLAIYQKVQLTPECQ